MADLEALQQVLGVSFDERALLEQALVHGSYINENPGAISNQRLEFLGDAVLGLVMAEKLYQKFPHYDEGELTKLRSVLVRSDTLAWVARLLRIGDYLYLGKGEELSGGRHKSANLAGALEAIIAAIFLDQGLASAEQFVLRCFEPVFTRAVESGEEFDYKSQLQELIQSRQQKVPTYHVVAKAGPEHDKVFTIEVRLGNRVLGRGQGKGKKRAEIEAARSALDELPNNFTE